MKDKHKKTEDEIEDVVFESEENSAPTDQIKKLREKLKKALEERDEYLAGWQRAKADIINTKKVAEQEREMRAKYAAESVIEGLLPVLDSFHLARANKEVWEKVDQNWRQGIEYIHAQLLQTLSDHGLSVIDPEVGAVCDLSKHTSIENVDTDDTNMDGRVAGVVQQGYELSGKVMRPARVKVFHVSAAHNN